ncbi:carbonic anhydrase family protein [Qipengyuania sp. XHP0207]|uniref:carbonic anhydrase n=1 Tax=Qipengyuania sp. XHP0207 TaxID=3038078 RepID=UPI00241E305B|nr:carbonic anhydrase family protein [Qipengyuania sp. XHP0207]MDG5747993.1 carbonic anhydrase family protein [Qipengyuania sp. XHP0207]
MKKIALATTLALGLSTAAFAQNKDWNFGDGETPERWGAINAEYAACDIGKMQSPIDLTNPDVIGTVNLTTNFGQARGTLALGEEKVQIDFAPGQNKGMMSGTKAFNLLQVHFHTPAEHAVNGMRYPMVAHFVHATSGGELGVLGVFFTEGDSNPALASLLNAHSQGNGTALSVDIDDMVPDTVEVYRYMGSLTTPPCSEGVNWHVANVPVEASADQIAKLTAALGPSARSIQDRNGRLLVAPE